MDLPVRARPPHEVPSWVAEGSFFFITINCASRGVNHLCRAVIGDAVLAAAVHNHTKLAWHCQLMLLMPDHLHAIIAFPHEPGMKKTIANWKHFLATHQQIEWQRDFFDRRLRSHHEMEEKTGYILMNPVRRNHCQRAEDWPWICRPSRSPAARAGLNW